MMQPNTNPKTGIRYGVIACNSLDPELAQELWYGKNLSYEAACADLRKELEREADDIEDEARIAIAERGYNHAEYDGVLENEVEDAYQRLGYDDREDYIECKFEAIAQDFQTEEPVIEGTYEGVTYHITWLGGAPILYVFEGPIGYVRSLCSPCVPNCGDLDSGFYTQAELDKLVESHMDGTSSDDLDDGYECYVVPRDWLRSEE